MPAPKPRRGNRGQAHRQEVAKRVERQRAQRIQAQQPAAPPPARRATAPAKKGAPRPSAPRGLGGEQVEGRHAVRELLVAKRRRVRDVWLAEGLDESPLLAEIEGLCEDNRVPVRRYSRTKIDDAARTDAPQGVIAHADPLPETDIETLVRRARERRPFLVVLDGITDPHNLGALLRTAECAGATGAVLPRHRAAHVTPTVAKAAAGAIEYLPMAVVPGIPNALTLLKERGVWTVGLDADADRTLFDLEVATEPVALVFGAEGAGLSRLVKERCDLVVSIPQLGRLDSLNVSAAGAVACYEVARRRAL